jgi:predicted AlkP superfamily pyrophosphatase or phosphodiesterase
VITTPRVVRSLVLVCVGLLWSGGCETAPLPREPVDVAGTGGINRREHREKPHLILLSFDGFRPEYLDRFDLPNFTRAITRGARAQAMIPVFPTLTFPNHYSLVTGLSAERHGIVAISFYDPGRNATYSFRDEQSVTDGTWYRGEPIWVTAETQGMVAACYFWPGSEAAIKGVRPTIWNKYDAGTANDARVATVLEWLRLPADRRPHVITLYFSELDGASHQNALDSPAITRAAQSLDRSLGALLDGIDALPIRDQVYVLLTSDHGMAETSTARTIMLGSLVDTNQLRVGFSGPIASLHVPGGIPAAERIRSQINARLEHGRAYLRSELPERYRYGADPRVGDVVIVMDESWMIVNTRPLTGIIRDRWGMHGWDPDLPSMRALFVIVGPGIPSGVSIPAVENIDVYPFMTELLGLRAADGIEGRAGRIRALLTAAAGHPQ